MSSGHALSMDLHPALPTQRGLHPALTRLLALPIEAVKAFGPRRAAQVCDAVGTGFLRAVDSGALRLGSDVGLTPEDIEQAADWLIRAARTMERACQ